jgi:uncharacterized protein YecA (UPF0149 family)
MQVNDPGAGRLFSEDELKKRFRVETIDEAIDMAAAIGKKIVKIDLGRLTAMQLARKPPKVGRNEPCPCGSGKKFKKCCLVTK